VPAENEARPAAPGGSGLALGRDSRRAARRRIASLVTLLGLVLFTAWNATRSRALEFAQPEFDRRDYRRALGHALDHLERRPWSRDAALMAARCLTRLDYPDQAELFYRWATRPSIEDLGVRAHTLLRAGRYGSASQVYKEILAKQPEDLTTLRNLAAARLGQGDQDEVLALAEQLANKPGGEVMAWTFRGVVYHDRRDCHDAITACERVIALDPEFREMPLPKWLFWRNFADDLVAVGRGRDASRYLAQAVDQNPNAALWCLLGRIRQYEGNIDEAVHCFRRSAELDENDDLPRFYLGQIALQRGELNQALALLQQASLRSPKRYETAYSLALTYSRLGRPAEAEHWRWRSEKLRKERDARQ